VDRRLKEWYDIVGHVRLNLLVEAALAAYNAHWNGFTFVEAYNTNTVFGGQDNLPEPHQCEGQRSDLLRGLQEPRSWSGYWVNLAF
jgi:hypothetical protein